MPKLPYQYSEVCGKRKIDKKSLIYLFSRDKKEEKTNTKRKRRLSLITSEDTHDLIERSGKNSPVANNR